MHRGVNDNRRKCQPREDRRSARVSLVRTAKIIFSFPPLRSPEFILRLLHLPLGRSFPKFAWALGRASRFFLRDSTTNSRKSAQWFTDNECFRPDSSSAELCCDGEQTQLIRGTRVGVCLRWWINICSVFGSSLLQDPILSAVMSVSLGKASGAKNQPSSLSLIARALVRPSYSGSKKK